MRHEREGLRVGDDLRETVGCDGESMHASFLIEEVQGGTAVVPTWYKGDGEHATLTCALSCEGRKGGQRGHERALYGPVVGAWGSLEGERG